MAGFLSHLVQRTLAASPAILPRLAGPYEGSREPAATRDGDGGAEAITALDLVRGRASPPLEPPAKPGEGSSRAPYASSSPDFVANAHYQPEEPTMPAYANSPTVPDQRDVTLAPRADAAALVMPPVRVPQVRTPFPGSDTSTARHPQTTAEAPEPVEPGHSPSQPISIRWPAEVPRFEPMDRGNGHVAEDNASRSSNVPSIDPSPAIQTVRQKKGMLVEPPTPQASTPQHKGGDVQPRISPQPVAAPTIHVTIGRIELRASAPAATPAPSRPAANRPALSLADYLERRTKAGAP